MPRQKESRSEVAKFKVLDASATLFQINDVSHLREVVADWNSWSALNGRPEPLFNWVAVFNLNAGPCTRALCLEIAETVQALMYLRTDHVVRCDTGARAPLVYVAFLEVAPWNKHGSTERRHRGLGPVMVAVARELSTQRGLGGRVGLHSVPASEGFYRRIGFRSLDCPNEYNELYLEFDDLEGHSRAG